MRRWNPWRHPSRRRSRRRSGRCSGFSAPAAARPYSDACTLRPAASALPCHQFACVATTWPAPSKRSESRGQSASISSSSISHSRARSSRALAQRSSNSTALRPSNVGATKRGQSEPSSAVTRSMSSASLTVSAALTGVVQAQLAEDHPGRRGEHAVAAGDLLGELGQCGGVHHATARGAAPTAATPRRRGGRRPRRPPRRRPCRRWRRRPAHRRAGAPSRTTAHAGALTGAERDLDRDVLDPAVAEFPGLGDPFGDGGRPLARRAEHRAQLIVDRVGKHWADRACRYGPAW